LTEKEINQKLSELKHPVFVDAIIDKTTVMWTVQCTSCGCVHKIFTDESYIDGCCKNPKFNKQPL